MKKIVRNILIFNLLAPVWLGAQNAGEVSFYGKNLHELRGMANRAEAQRPLLASPPTTCPSQFERIDRSFFDLIRADLVVGGDANNGSTLPSAFCAADLAFFCRLELKMDKALRTPIRFRLGSQDYVDWLERKSSARFMDFKN